ncbi:DUF2358 domain-containing protein [Cephalotus follicularis]|uniref:DUF2358 domain-containing protein n=1 Tax=Cephalotus follicularis TaxID=3775 RepID=A0A1Q3BPE1_CEPFO|nr:DUF2358 domain-containing protein [Cephalotus follicularis]
MASLASSPEIFTISSTIFHNPNPKNVKNLTIVRKEDKIGSSSRSRIGVCFKIKESGAGLSKLDQNERLYGQFSAPAKPSLKQGKEEEEEEKQNYYVNMGYAIRTLREELPDLFFRELSFDIYRNDIVFKDPLNTFISIQNYKSIFWALRFHGRILFKALWVDIISVWQPVENIIMVRWAVHGIPRVPWESRGRFDGTSEYKLDKNGKIYEHRVDNIAINSPPKFGVLAVEELLQSIGCSSTPKPTYFDISSSSSERT